MLGHGIAKLFGLASIGGGATIAAAISTDAFTPVIAVALAALLVLVPLCARYLQLWLEARIQILEASNAQRHTETMDGLIATNEAGGLLHGSVVTSIQALAAAALEAAHATTEAAHQPPATPADTGAPTT